MSRVTLSRYLIEQTRSNNTPADLRFLIEVVARACKEISHHVSKGALGGVLGSMGTENVQGEVQKKLDVISNDILLEANPGLIYARLTGWGQTGPYARKVGHDINYLAISGTLKQIGADRPTAPPPFSATSPTAPTIW